MNIPNQDQRPATPSQTPIPTSQIDDIIVDSLQPSPKRLKTEDVVNSVVDATSNISEITPLPIPSAELQELASAVSEMKPVELSSSKSTFDTISKLASTETTQSPTPIQPTTKPSSDPPVTKTRLLLLYDQPRFPHMKLQIEDLKRKPYETLTVIELQNATELESKFNFVNLSIEYNDEFESNMEKFIKLLESKPKFITEADEVAYHFQFDRNKKWSEYKKEDKDIYQRFLSVLSEVAGDKVVQCSVINKYELSTVYLTEKEDLARLGQEIQDDIKYWKNLKVFDYGGNCLRFLPGVRFPDCLEVLNVGGGFSLESLGGFKMPAELKSLYAHSGSITNIDSIVFPYMLERLNLMDNKIYFLNQVEFPPMMTNLDLSHNRIESLKGVNFPRKLKSLSISGNPIECIRGARFPEGLLYLDLSCIPNESMTSVKFPDLLVSLNLQQSMTNTRGLKLPPLLKNLNLGYNGVNSINPLKLPNSIESLYLGYNNIKTLNKVQFPSYLKELYLGNNMITTIKNVQFPNSLELLDLEMDPELDEHDKYLTNLKDVVFPPNLRTLRLGYHAIKAIEGVEFPNSLVTLSLAYNELKVIKNVKFGNQLKVLDLSGNQELTNIDQLLIPESVVELRVPSQLINNLPAYIVERANKHSLFLSQSEPFAM